MCEMHAVKSKKAGKHGFWYADEGKACGIKGNGPINFSGSVLGYLA